MVGLQRSPPAVGHRDSAPVGLALHRRCVCPVSVFLSSIVALLEMNCLVVHPALLSLCNGLSGAPLVTRINSGSRWLYSAINGYGWLSIYGLMVP